MTKNKYISLVTFLTSLMFLVTNILFAQEIKNTLKIDREEDKKLKLKFSEDSVVINNNQQEQDAYFNQKNIIETNMVKYEIFKIDEELDELNKTIYSPENFIEKQGDFKVDLSKVEKKKELEEKKMKLDSQLKEIETKKNLQ